MSDETRKEMGSDEIQPKDEELYTPQGGGSGTGSGPVREVAAVEGAPKTGPKEDLREEVLRPGKITLPQVAAAKLKQAEEEKGPVPVQGEEEEEDEVSSLRLLLTLGVSGAIAGALLVFVFLWSQPKILAYEAMILREAVTEVLKGPDHFESVFLLDGTLVAAEAVPPEVDTLDLDRVFLGYDASGAPVGFAMEAQGFGFQDIIALIFGYDPQTDQVLGMKVLRHLETPGLGDKIVKDQGFVSEFDGVEAPLVGVKTDRSTGAPDQVDMITGATISSKAVIKIINDRITQMKDLLAAYEPTGGVQVQGEGQ